MIMEEEVEWMKKWLRTERNRKGEEEDEEKEADASLWSSVRRSRHPLFIALLLVLQSGVGHGVTPSREGRGENGCEQRGVTEGYDEWEGEAERKSEDGHR